MENFLSDKSEFENLDIDKDIDLNHSLNIESEKNQTFEKFSKKARY